MEEGHALGKEDKVTYVLNEEGFLSAARVFHRLNGFLCNIGSCRASDLLAANEIPIWFVSEEVLIMLEIAGHARGLLGRDLRAELGACCIWGKVNLLFRVN